ncbi:MAG: hypothetical protein AAF989_06380 [Planctomycetota bacterium]
MKPRSFLFWPPLRLAGQHAPEENINARRDRQDSGYEVIRNAQYQRRVATGRMALKIASLSSPEYDQPWESLSAESKNRLVAQMEVYAAMIERIDEDTRGVKDLLHRQGR